MKKASAWNGSTLDQADELSSVSAGGGLMIAGGESRLYRMRPGMSTLQGRPFPFEDDVIRVVAVEPRRPHRAAVASEGALVLWDFASDDAGYRHVKLDPDAPVTLGLAWGMVKGKSILHVLGDDGVVLRSTPGHPLEEIPLEHAVAIANDAAGVLAILTDGEDAATLYASDNGESWKYRQLPTTITDPTTAYVAMHTTTAAVVIDGYLWISRDPDSPFELQELDGQSGAIAVGDDGAVYAAMDANEDAGIVRVASNGEVVRIHDLIVQSAAIAWDASRKALWATSVSGLVMATPPGHTTTLS
jgi:hypothetical protein